MGMNERASRRGTIEQIVQALVQQYQPERVTLFGSYAYGEPDRASLPPKASRVLDRYQRVWDGEPLGDDDYVLSPDEKSGLQIWRRRHPTRPPRARQMGQVAFASERLGTLVYQAVLDVHRGMVMGLIQPTNSMATFNDLVDLMMTTPPYDPARRVFWPVDSGGSHHPATFPARLAARHEHALAVHLPTHANWLNQIELSFSIL